MRKHIRRKERQNSGGKELEEREIDKYIHIVRERKEKERRR